MLAIKIWNYLKGYVIIRIKGLTLERLLNLALSKDIYLWNVNRISNTTIEATVSLLGIDSLEEIINKSGCKVEIVKRVGFPFILNKLKHRKAFALGLIIFFCFIIFLSSIIWKIEIVGAEQIPAEEIIELLYDNDISEGRFKRQIDIDEISKIILENYDYLSFLDIQINGVKLTIELKEIDVEPERLDNSYPCNIIAKRKGVIVKIIAESGNAVVKKGQIVEENDLLISGLINSELSGDSYLVHADGIALAETRYSYTIEEPIIRLDKVETGRTYSQWGISIDGKGIRFLSGDIPYENYIEEIVEKTLFNLEWLPFRFVNYIYREVEINEIKQNIDFLKASTKLEATREINKQLSDKSEIISRNAIYTIEDNILRTKVNIDILEDIGKVQAINSN